MRDYTRANSDAIDSTLRCELAGGHQLECNISLNPQIMTIFVDDNITGTQNFVIIEAQKYQSVSYGDLVCLLAPVLVCCPQGGPGIKHLERDI